MDDVLRDAAERAIRYRRDVGNRPVWPTAVAGGPSNCTRTAQLSVRVSREVALDAIFALDEFDLGYYRQLVRNGLETPATLRSIRRWTQSPKIYLKVVDEAGSPIDTETLDTVQRHSATTPERSPAIASALP